MDHRHGTPSAWVAAHMTGVKPGGSVLDVACGGGRHLRHALALGFRVTGVDRTLASAADLAGRADVTLVEADLETGGAWPFSDRAFDAVIVTNYLWRPIFAEIVGSVARDGVLIYETFAAGNERHGSPRNPDFLLRPGELIERTRPRLIPVAYQHVGLREPSRIVQRIVAVGPDHKWLNDPPSAQF